MNVDIVKHNIEFWSLYSFVKECKGRIITRSINRPYEYARRKLIQIATTYEHIFMPQQVLLNFIYKE